MSVLYQIDPCFAYRRPNTTAAEVEQSILAAIGPTTAMLNTTHMALAELTLLDASALHVAPTRFDPAEPHRDLFALWAAGIREGWFTNAATTATLLQTPDFLYLFLSGDQLVEREARLYLDSSGWEDRSLTEEQYDVAASHVAAVRRAVGGPFREDDLRRITDRLTDATVYPFTRDPFEEVVRTDVPLRRLANLLSFALPVVMPEEFEDWQVRGLVAATQEVVRGIAEDASWREELPDEFLNLEARIKDVSVDTLVNGLRGEEQTNTLGWPELSTALDQLLSRVIDPDGPFGRATVSHLAEAQE